MKNSTIEELAYRIKQAKEDGSPQPIVFLGAGASITGGIPLASQIIDDISERFKDNPRIKTLKEGDKTYPKMMECLTPSERNRLLKEYIDKAKINVTHIYLAQLLSQGFVDYVLTVNFDDLMLRALALFNEFPPTYDMAILKDLTTTSFKKKSVVYLHGQHHGLWLLNTVEEMEKVKEIVAPILNSIKNERPWIFIGYSGDDPIFEHITKLGRFDNGLYWIALYEKIPTDNVCKNLLDRLNTNAFLVKGYDADSFMLKLSNELGLAQPIIIDKPFTSLSISLDNIVDIDDKEHFKGVKERLAIVKKDVMKAIQQFEKGEILNADISKIEIDLSILQKEIIDKMINEDFEENAITVIEQKASVLQKNEIFDLLSQLYNSWGNWLSIKAVDSQKKVELYELSLEKYAKAANLNPNDGDVFYNWGLVLSELAKLKTDEILFQQACEKYSESANLNPTDEETFLEWGKILAHFANKTNDENLFEQCFNKYAWALQLNPKHEETYASWATALHDLANLKQDTDLFQEAFQKFQIAADLNATENTIFNNWGNALLDFAILKADERLYPIIFEKYKIALNLAPDDAIVFKNWGIALSEFAGLKKDEGLYLQSIEKFEKAINLDPKDASILKSWGNALSDFAVLKKSEALYLESIEKFEIATKLDPKDDLIFDGWGLALINHSKLKKDASLLEKSIEVLQRATDLVETSYNLSCAYALKKDKKNALKFLEMSLEKNKIDSEYIATDEDWDGYRSDKDYINLINKYNS